jgi:hypothetical protein
MPIEFQIDHQRRLVIARAHGILAGQDLFDYQKSVWSRPDVAGYSELIDMSGVESIEAPTGQRIRQLASLSAAMDAETRSKFAIVASDEFAFGLGRMYETYRGLEEGSTKEVRVFRTMEQAMAFLADSDSNASQT